MRKPVVVLDALLVTERPTGVGRSILELTRAMAESARGMDFRLLVTTEAPFSYLEDAPEWEIVRCPGAERGTLGKAFFTQAKLPGLCRRLGADILHSLQFVAPWRLPCASVVTVHDLAWQLYPDTVEQPRRSYYRLLVPATLRRAQVVVTNSEATAADVRRLHPGAQRVEVTPFGTPSWVDQVPRDTERVEIPGWGGRPFFLFVGTLEPRKNLQNLLEAYALLLDEPGDWPGLLLVGSKGWRDSGLRRQIEPLQDAGHVQVMDYCGIDQLGRLYRSARALLFPSLHEGFGFPILEAMALDLPVLTAGRGAMAEVAAGAALLVDPEDAAGIARDLARLTNDTLKRSEMVAAGRRNSAAWTWQRTARRTLDVYRSLLS